MSSQVAKLREETGAGVMDCKHALDDAGGDFKKAKAILAKNAEAIAKKKSERVTKQGLVEAYIHAGRVGVLVELRCESDFVAKNPEFKNLAHNLALQIASMSPKNIDELLAQEYIMDPGRTIDAYIKSVISKIRENIQIQRFERFELGEE